MLSQGLDDEEIADLMNYILNSWGNTYEAQITTEEVKKNSKISIELNEINFILEKFKKKPIRPC